jgi:hypothetical protein
MAEHDEVADELSAEPLVGPVVNFELGRVRHVERAAVAGSEQGGRPRPSPLRRPQVKRVRHRAKLSKTLGGDWPAGRGRQPSPMGTGQLPDAPARILHDSVALQIRERPREIVIDQSRILLVGALGRRSLELTAAEVPVAQGAIPDCVTARLAAKRLQCVKARSARLPPELAPLRSVQIWAHTVYSTLRLEALRSGPPNIRPHGGHRHNGLTNRGRRLGNGGSGGSPPVCTPSAQVR